MLRHVLMVLVCAALTLRITTRAAASQQPDPADALVVAENFLLADWPELSSAEMRRSSMTVEPQRKGDAEFSPYRHVGSEPVRVKGAHRADC